MQSDLLMDYECVRHSLSHQSDNEFENEQRVLNQSYYNDNEFSFSYTDRSFSEFRVDSPTPTVRGPSQPPPTAASLSSQQGVTSNKKTGDNISGNNNNDNNNKNALLNVLILKDYFRKQKQTYKEFEMYSHSLKSWQNMQLKNIESSKNINVCYPFLPIIMDSYSGIFQSNGC